MKELIFNQKKKNLIGIIDIFGISNLHNDIRSFLKENNILLIAILNLTLDVKNTNFQKLLSFLYKENKFQIIYRKLLKPVKETYNLNNADIVLLNGNYGKKFINKNQKSINLCHFDYDIYSNLKKKKIIKQKKDYALFLDQFLPLHSGQNYIGTASKKIDIRKYYYDLENFFQNFEKKYNLEIIVAAHPRSDYKKNKLIKKGRKFFINKTAELVKNSKVVFTHHSVSYNFAILFKKPIFFLTLSSYKRVEAFVPEFLSKYFKTFCFNIEKKKFKFPLKGDLLSISKSTYTKYKNDYLVAPGYKGSNSWKEFIKKIKKIL